MFDSPSDNPIFGTDFAQIIRNGALSILKSELNRRLHCGILSSDAFCGEDDVSEIMKILNSGGKVDLTKLSDRQLAVLIQALFQFALDSLLPSNESDRRHRQIGKQVSGTIPNIPGIMQHVPQENMVLFIELLDLLHGIFMDWNRMWPAYQITSEYLAKSFVPALVFTETLDDSWTFLAEMLQNWPDYRPKVTQVMQSAPKMAPAPISITARRFVGWYDSMCWSFNTLAGKPYIFEVKW